MKLKNHIMIGMAAAMTMANTACSDFLEVESLNEITLEQFWNEEADVNSVVLGCYSALQSSDALCRMMVWGEFRSDNIIAGLNTENDADLQRLLKENITETNSYTKWGAFYDVINRCNTVLHYAPQVAEKDPNYTQSELKATQAEMTALRSLCYFYLIRTFKDVPYYTEPVIDDAEELPKPATPFNEVLDAMISDLEAVRPYAVTNYPKTNSYAQKGRITQSAIDAMLCEMYLWKQDYAKCVEYADKVITLYTSEYQKKLDQSTGSMLDPMVNGFPLISDKSTSFYGSAYNDIFGDGCSRESIFELVFMNDATSLANAGVNLYYGNGTTTVGYVKPADDLVQELTTDLSNDNTDVFRDCYDTRRYENINEESASSYAISKYAASYATVTVSGSTVKQTFSGYYDKDLCHANWIVYRLSDVMLMKAEALVEQMGTGDVLTDHDKELMTEALNIVNAINKRSYAATSYTDMTATSKSEMQDIVLAERRRELMFEGKRWFDLVRLAMREGKTDRLKSFVGVKGVENINRLSVYNAMFLPYNQDEMKVNGYLQQNSAYNSSK